MPNKGLLVRFFDEGWRHGYLVKATIVKGHIEIQPIGPIGKTPNKIKVEVGDVRNIDGGVLAELQKPAEEPESRVRQRKVKTTTKTSHIRRTKEAS